MMMERRSESFGEAVDEESHGNFFGIPNDIALVLAIDAVLISLRLSGVLAGHSFVGAKVLGTSALIGAHFLA
jgi:hypothetical protein